MTAYLTAQNTAGPLLVMQRGRRIAIITTDTDFCAQNIETGPENWRRTLAATSPIVQVTSLKDWGSIANLPSEYLVWQASLRLTKAWRNGAQSHVLVDLANYCFASERIIGSADLVFAFIGGQIWCIKNSDKIRTPTQVVPGGRHISFGVPF